MLQFKNNFSLSKVTTLQIGGPAKKYVAVKTQEELIEATKFAKDNHLEFLVIGGGSNLLISDEGVNKLVIKNEITGITTSKESKPTFEVRVKSGTILQDLVNYSIEHGLSGLQKLTGIPGTVGGAVYGNAGAYGQTISDHIVEVTVYESLIRSGMTKEECKFSYRDSGFKRNKYIILEVTFQLESGNPAALQKEADGVLAKRLVKYPVGIKCPGSFFKNIVAETLPKEILEKIPTGAIVYGKLPAGYLLEQVGAKGDKLGQIEIANYHANLFINTGKGTAKDFYVLAQKWAQKVKEEFGITLEPEVQLINLPFLKLPL